MTAKVTVKEQFVAVAEVLAEVGRDDLVEFINGRVAILDKKSATKSKAVATNQAKNEEIKADIVKALVDAGKAVNITELKTFGFEEYSTPKLSALLKQLKDEGKIVRTLEKKTPYFAAV